MPDVIRNSFDTSVTEEAERIDLSSFAPEEVDELLAGVLGDRVVFNVPQRRQLYRLSGGHPYILKLLLKSMLNSAPSDLLPLQITTAILEQATQAAAADSHVKHVLGNVLRVHFSPEERGLVTMMAGLDDCITLDQLDRAGKEWRTVAENLTRRGYLARESANGSYVFHFAFLGHWLRRQPDFEERLERLAELRHRLIVEIEIDAERRQVFVRSKEVHLTVQQFQALSFLCQHVDQAVSKDQLAGYIWPQAAGGVSDESIATIISRLRSKLGDDARRPRYIETVPGYGYTLHRAAFA